MQATGFHVPSSSWPLPPAGRWEPCLGRTTPGAEEHNAGSNNKQTLSHGTKFCSAGAKPSRVFSPSAAPGFNPVWSVYSMWLIFHLSPPSCSTATITSCVFFLSVFCSLTGSPTDFNPMLRKPLFLGWAFFHKRPLLSFSNWP